MKSRTSAETWATGLSCLALFTGTEVGQAITFAGTSSGVFQNPQGPPGMVTAGAGTSLFTWGVGAPPSALQFTGNPFNTMEEVFFQVGTLAFFNGTSVAGTEAEQVDLAVSLAFTLPTGDTATFTYLLHLINTPNTGDLAGDADTVLLPSRISSDLFTFNGVQYSLELAFGNAVGGGFSEIDRLSAFESSVAAAPLAGRISSRISSPSPVPESGTTLALFGIACLGLLGFIRLERV